MHARYADWLTARQAAVIAEDGDLEALQDSAAWRQRESLALQSRYTLSWVYLEAAIRYEPRHEQRQEWLRQAADGFGTVADAAEDPTVVAESLYGRGLCRRELGQPDGAITDLRRALDGAAPGLSGSIGSALIEALIEANRLDTALQESRTLLKRSPSGEADFLRAKVLLLALGGTSTDRKRRAAQRREVVEVMARLDRRGGEWARLGRELAAAGIRDPEEWLAEDSNPTIQWVVAEALRQRNECEKAIPLYESLAGKRSSVGEVLLALGACQLETLRYEEAYATLSAPLDGANDDQRADAAYLRFKAAEALQQSADTRENATRLSTEARGYIAAFPEHSRTFEAHYRLGELDRAAGKPIEAVVHYDAVPTDTPLHAQAMFESARCYVTEWERRNEATPGERNPELIAAALRKFERLFEAIDEPANNATIRVADGVVLSSIEAQARVLGALTLTRSDEDDALDKAIVWLDRFSAIDVPDASLQTQASLVRGIVLLKVGRYAEAGTAVNDFLVGYDPSRRNYGLLRHLAADVLELAEEQRRKEHPDAVRELENLALTVYSELLRRLESESIPGQSPEGLRRLIASLRRDR